MTLLTYIAADPGAIILSVIALALGVAWLANREQPIVLRGDWDVESWRRT